MNGAITSKPGWHSWILCSAARGGGAGRCFGVLWKGITPRARLDARERKGAQSCQPPGVKCPHRAPDRPQSRGEERASLAHWQRLRQFCGTPRGREPTRDAPAAQRRPRPRPRLRRPYLGPSPSWAPLCAPERGPAGTPGALEEVFSVTLFSARWA